MSTAEWPDICGFCSSELWNLDCRRQTSLCSFSIEEESLCEVQSRIATLCQRVKTSTFQVTAHIGPLKGTPNAIKSVWEPKEGGKVKSYKNCPGQALHHYGSGQAQNKKSDVRCQKSDVRFFCFLFSVFGAC